MSPAVENTLSVGEIAVYCQEGELHSDTCSPFLNSFFPPCAVIVKGLILVFICFLSQRKKSANAALRLRCY